MFRGTREVPDFDTPVQMAAGENNAFTNNDYTDFYMTLPKDNVETALWLESDRMTGLDISPQNLEIEKRVVIEEYKQPLPQPALRRHADAPARPGLPGTPLPLGNNRPCPRTHRRGFAGGGARLLPPLLPPLERHSLHLGRHRRGAHGSLWPKSGSPPSRIPRVRPIRFRRNLLRPSPGGWRSNATFRPR